MGKPLEGPGKARQIKALDSLLKSWAGKNNLKNKRLYACDKAVTGETARQPNAGAVVEFSTRAAIGLQHG